MCPARGNNTCFEVRNNRLVFCEHRNGVNFTLRTFYYDPHPSLMVNWQSIFYLPPFLLCVRRLTPPQVLPYDHVIPSLQILHYLHPLPPGAINGNWFLTKIYHTYLYKSCCLNRLSNHHYICSESYQEYLGKDGRSHRCWLCNHHSLLSSGKKCSIRINTRSLVIQINKNEIKWWKQVKYDFIVDWTV